MPKIINKFTAELVRRGVIRALGAYVVIVWLLAQGLVDLFPAVGLPEWSIRAFLAFAALATPAISILAWKYDLTSKGLLRDRIDAERERRNTLDRAIGPTQRSASRADGGRSIVNASWANDNGEACEREFQAALVIGRDFQADIRLSDDRVSRRHVQVYPVGDDWFVKDLESLNGTYVDGESIDVRQIEPEIEISLDKKGPKIRLAVRVSDETALSVEPVR